MENYELQKQVLETGFAKARSEVINEMPMDRNIILVPIRTRGQAKLCFEQGIEVYEKTMHNGVRILVAPLDFETIIKAVSKYLYK
jgi:hypothetical protein